MKGIIFEIEGNWGHFRKPETNNNPLKHDLITKTALIGMIGAVLGKNRDEMVDLFPIWSKNLLYGVQILNDVKKFSFGFTSWKLGGTSKEGQAQVRKRMEIIKDPKYRIALALKSKASENEFDDFVVSLKEEKAKYTPVLGLHNCPAILKSESVVESDFEEKEESESEFEIYSFVALTYQELTKVTQTKNFRVGIDRIPTFQENFFNPLDDYVSIAFPTNGNSVFAKGKYYEFTKDKSKWALI
jgi:CRISPR-associated protein Cas5h